MLFRYPGGKNKSGTVSTIMGRFPDSYDEYREPMVGSGGIFWNIPTSKTRWINDLDGGLMAVYLALRDRPDDFIQKCKAIEPQRDDEEYIHVGKGGKSSICVRLRDKFLEMLGDHSDPALRWFFINRTVFMGRMVFDWPSGSMASRLRCSYTGGWNIVKRGKLEQAAKILQGTRITNISYQECLFEPGQNVLIYLDPPYYKDTMRCRTNKLYQHSFGFADHATLAENVRKTPHKVIISYDDVPEIRSLFSGLNIHSCTWRYTGRVLNDDNIETRVFGKELIITNF